jgi:hypothetical protein
LESGFPSARLDGEFTALEECNYVIASIESKADKNKVRARRSAGLLTGATALVPVFLILAEAFDPANTPAFVLGRVIPGLLAFAAALLARWIQIEQPHQRWTLYRRWQRIFEAERLRYQQRIEKYAEGDRDKKLAAVLANGQLELDEEWASLVPRSRALTDETQTSSE